MHEKFKESLPVSSSKAKLKYLIDNLEIIIMDMNYHSNFPMYWFKKLVIRENYFHKLSEWVYYLIVL